MPAQDVVYRLGRDCTPRYTMAPVLAATCQDHHSLLRYSENGGIFVFMNIGKLLQVVEVLCGQMPRTVTFCGTITFPINQEASAASLGASRLVRSLGRPTVLQATRAPDLLQRAKPRGASILKLRLRCSPRAKASGPRCPWS